MNDPTKAQLAALAEVAEMFRERGIEYWLFGGWAVDFHAGFVTRDHEDVDLAVWLNDLSRIGPMLESEGWLHAPAVDEDGGTGYERDGIRLELTYLVRADDGAVYVPLRGGRGSWPDGGLEADVRELLGTRSRVVALAALVEMKSHARDDPGDAEKDRADSATLSCKPS